MFYYRLPALTGDAGRKDVLSKFTSPGLSGYLCRPAKSSCKISFMHLIRYVVSFQ